VIQEQPTPPQTPQPPRSEPQTPAEIRKAHFDAISGLLARYEGEFVDLVKNQNAPADAVSHMLTAIQAMRLEVVHLRP